MAELRLHGRRVKTVFDLLGNKENDITYSVGWALAKCDAFRDLLLERLFPDRDVGDVEAIYLQERGTSQGVVGYTDIEIVAKDRRVIIEAKRGWNLPTPGQLEKYASYLEGDARNTGLVVITQAMPAYARLKLPTIVRGIPVKYLSWKEVADIAVQSRSSSNNASKRLLRELSEYLRGLMKMQNLQSNMVYVVVLAGGRPKGSSISWRDIVIEKSRYFHEVGPMLGWPKEPPNYIAFRYDGKLQRIHHIDAYMVVHDANGMNSEIPGICADQWWDGNPHFLYTLGPAIVPGHEVKTGNIYPNGRVWAMIDLLLTCSTISEARDLTQERLKNET